MDPELEQFLEHLFDAGREHDASTSDRRERMRNVEPESARMLAVLVRALRPRRMLELGTSNGYSTIWLADAARAVGGRLTSVDIDSGRHAQSQQNLQCAGLSKCVELRLEDAQQTLAGAPDDAWDMIFLDAERPAYTSYWPELVRTLSPSGLLIVDNAISHEHELIDFRALVEREEGVMEATVPIGAGMLLVVGGAVGPVG
jgi:predicted O-methyltransferase YrrM